MPYPHPNDSEFPTFDSDGLTEAGPPIVNGMSVDVEEYFHVTAFDNIVARESWQRRESRVCASTDRLLAMFEESDVKATFFILGWVAERHPDLVRRVVQHGHEVASHGLNHELVYNLTPGQFRTDVRRAKAILEAISGQAVLGYRAPSYSITNASLWALEVLVEEGYVYDASVYPICHDRYGIPGAPRHVNQVATPAGTIWELPGSTARVAGVNLPIGGGGYFRQLPYWWTRWGINRVNCIERRPAIFYLHPWELDPRQPRLRASRVSRLRHYRNLQCTEGRLQRLLGDFAFGPLTSVLSATMQRRSDGVSAVPASALRGDVAPSAGLVPEHS